MSKIIVLSFLIIILSLFLIRSKIKKFLDKGLQLGVIFFSILIISSLFFKQPFDFTVEKLFENSGLERSIYYLDEKLEGVEDLQNQKQEIIYKLKNFLSDENENGRSNEVYEEKGILERTLYDGFLNMTSFLLRVLCVFIGLSGLITLLYFSYSITSQKEIIKIKQKIKELENNKKINNNL